MMRKISYPMRLASLLLWLSSAATLQGQLSEARARIDGMT
jgi:hypothetical protein